MKVTGTEQISASHEPRAEWNPDWSGARADAVLVCRPQRRFTVPLVMFATLLIGADYAVACPVCFGDPESGMAQGAMWGIMVLGLFIGSVLMGMVGVGVTWFIRARKLDE